MTQPSPEIFHSRNLPEELSRIELRSLDPEALFILRRLRKHDFRALLVGGCVRDLLLGHDPKDFDIATSARPRQIKRVFRNSRIIGRRFRLVHVHFARGKIIEVSTFRSDPTPRDDAGLLEEDENPDEILPVGTEDPDELRVDADPQDEVEPQDEDEPDEVEEIEEEDEEEDEDDDLLIVRDNVFGTEAEDARRRDFTINGLFYDPEQDEIIDYVGGVADLRKRVLRTIGSPDRRVREDPVRILRAVKFVTRLDLTLEPELAASMAEYHEDLARSAPPRVFEELMQMLGRRHPERAFEILAHLGILALLVPELNIRPHQDESVPHLPRLRARLRALAEIDRGRRSQRTALYVAVLLYDAAVARLRRVQEGGESEPSSHALLEELIRPIALRFRLSRRDAAQLRSIFLALRRMDPSLSGARRRRSRTREFVRRDFFLDALCLLRIASEVDQCPPELYQQWEQRRRELAGETADPPTAGEAGDDEAPPDESSEGAARPRRRARRSRSRRRRRGRNTSRS